MSISLSPTAFTKQANTNFFTKETRTFPGHFKLVRLFFEQVYVHQK